MTKETCLKHSGIAEAVKDIKEDMYSKDRK
jgi:hypothetical protein